MSFQIKGKLHTIFPVQIVSEKFRKQEFVIEVPDDKYPQFIKLQAVNERIDLLDSYDQGDTMTVHFDIQGREVVKPIETFYFTTLNMWKLEGNAAPKGQSGKPMTKVSDLEEPLIMPLNENDKPYDTLDLPF